MPSTTFQFSLTAEQYPAEIEDEANAYFQRIYNQPPNNITIDDVLDMLKQFKDSSVKRERVIPCIVVVFVLTINK